MTESGEQITLRLGLPDQKPTMAYSSKLAGTHYCRDVSTNNVVEQVSMADGTEVNPDKIVVKIEVNVMGVLKISISMLNWREYKNHL